MSPEPKALGTSDYRSALYLSRYLSINADGLFNHVMSTPQLSKETINELAREWLAEALEMDEEQRINTPFNKSVYSEHHQNLDIKPQQTDVEVLSHLQGEFVEALACLAMLKPCWNRWIYRQSQMIQYIRNWAMYCYGQI